LPGRLQMQLARLERSKSAPRTLPARRT
jgi:hypothetical protein